MKKKVLLTIASALLVAVMSLTLLSCGGKSFKGEDKYRKNTTGDKEIHATLKESKDGVKSIHFTYYDDIKLYNPKLIDAKKSLTELKENADNEIYTIDGKKFTGMQILTYRVDVYANLKDNKIVVESVKYNGNTYSISKENKVQKNDKDVRDDITEAVQKIKNKFNVELKEEDNKISITLAELDEKGNRVTYEYTKK